MVVGWGLISAKGGNADTLQRGPMVLQKHRLNAIQIFTKPYGPNKSSACKGDSGGPLLCLATGGQLIQAGVTTGIYSPHCGAPDKPVIFANVAAVLDWIRSKM